MTTVNLCFHNALPHQHGENQLSLPTSWTLVLSPSWRVDFTAHMSRLEEHVHVVWESRWFSLSRVLFSTLFPHGLDLLVWTVFHGVWLFSESFTPVSPRGSCSEVFVWVISSLGLGQLTNMYHNLSNRLYLFCTIFLHSHKRAFQSYPVEPHMILLSQALIYSESPTKP